MNASPRPTTEAAAAPRARFASDGCCDVAAARTRTLARAHRLPFSAADVGFAVSACIMSLCC
jgi:hypothetical protein